MQAFGFLPRKQYLGSRPGRERQSRPDRNGVAKPSRELRRGDTHPDVALSSVELRALTRCVAQFGQNRAGHRDEAVLAAGGRELGKSGAEHESAFAVAGHEAVSFEGDRKPVGGRPRETGERDETCQ